MKEMCPRKESQRYKTAKYPEEKAWRDSVYVCSVRRGFGMKGEYSCPDCGYYPPLFVPRKKTS